jgi:type I restriction enzyme R subunit
MYSTVLLREAADSKAETTQVGLTGKTMGLNESDTRSKLIDPAIYKQGWTEEMIRREETAGAIEVVDGKARKRRGRMDYTLRIKLNLGNQPVAVAILEAKAESKQPTEGLEQAKLYASAKRMNVPFVFSANGHLFVEYDRLTGATTKARPMAEFPTPQELQRRYEEAVGFKLDSEAAKPLLVPYPGGDATRRYYQDAAIRAVLEKLARGEKRALLTLATGAGKTFIAVNLLKRIADAGQLKRALFVCDRDELRSQGLGAFQAVFGTEAAEVLRKPDGSNNAKNARIHIATYQTLGVDSLDGDANFLREHYPENYFSHIVIDECHRSAWGKWSEVLTRNADAAQVGLTATPRELEVTEDTPEAREDAEITADNLRYFGEPVYDYDIAQGIEDGYLAACEIVRRDIFLDRKNDSEQASGLTREDLEDKTISDARTGAALTVAEAKPRYEASRFEAAILLPERVEAMAKDVFAHLMATGGPEQKTIIFCARDAHADAVAAAMNNLYAAWCKSEGNARTEPYAFKCTAKSGGSDLLADFRGGARHHFIATTVELLTTGVDVPKVRNIVFFKYVRSPIAFYQMVGRGTRLDPASEKLMFRVYDYTNATRLFGEAFRTKITKNDGKSAGGDGEPPDDGTPPERILEVVGFDVRVSDAGRYIVTMVDGKATLVTVEEYRAMLAARLVAEAPTVEAFRESWIEPERRRELMAHLPDGGRSAALMRALQEMADYDLFDVLTEVGYGAAPRTREARADAFTWKHDAWLKGLPSTTAATLKALSGQFRRGGTEELENPKVFQMPEVVRAGGLTALGALGNARQALQEAKRRIFAA